MMHYTLALSVCNSLTNCSEILDANSISVILSQIDTLSEDEQNLFWNSYKANYFAIKQRIQTVFANIYAHNRGGYNGAIGTDPAPISMISILSTYNENVLNAIEPLINNC